MWAQRHVYIMFMFITYQITYQMRPHQRGDWLSLWSQTDCNSL